MDSDRFFKTLRRKRLSDEIVSKIANDFVNDHRISEHEKSARDQSLSWLNDNDFINLIVSRVSFFSSVILSESSENLQRHDVQTVYDEMRLQYLTGMYAKLAAFTLSTFIDQRQSLHFTILPVTKLKVVSSLRALNMQTELITTPDENLNNKANFVAD